MKLQSLTILLLLTINGLGQNEKLKSPSDLAKEFIIDYYEWNNYAVKKDQEKTATDDAKIEKKYRKIIRKYCGTKKDYQGISYGTLASHNPKYEKIVDQLLEGSKAIVITKYIDPERSYDYADYEYHFIRKKNRWFLEEVYYVDEEGKYKSL